MKRLTKYEKENIFLSNAAEDYTHGDNDLKVAAASLQNEYLNNFLKAEK